MCEVSDDNKEDDGVPSLGREDSSMTKLDEMGHLPSLGETKSPKQDPTSDHVFSCDGDVDHISHDKLVMEQEHDPDLKDLGQRSLTFQESEEVPVCLYKHNGVLMRKWRPPDAPANEEWRLSIK